MKTNLDSVYADSNNEILVESGRELKRFIAWIKENPSEWECIQNPDGFQPTMERIGKIIASLIDSGLYSMAFWAVCSLGCSSREMELMQHRIKMECVEEIPVECLMGII